MNEKNARVTVVTTLRQLVHCTTCWCSELSHIFETEIPLRFAPTITTVDPEGPAPAPAPAPSSAQNAGFVEPPPKPNPGGGAKPLPNDVVRGCGYSGLCAIGATGGVETSGTATKSNTN